GCVLYELASGSRAFRAEELALLRARVASGSCVDVAVHRPDIPRELADAIRGAMEPDRSARIPDCDVLLAVWRGEHHFVRPAVVREPQEALFGATVPPPNLPPSVSSRSERRSSYSPRRVVAGAAFAALLGFGAGQLVPSATAEPVVIGVPTREPLTELYGSGSVERFERSVQAAAARRQVMLAAQPPPAPEATPAPEEPARPPAPVAATGRVRLSSDSSHEEVWLVGLDGRGVPTGEVPEGVYAVHARFPGQSSDESTNTSLSVVVRAGAVTEVRCDGRVWRCVEL
ncbi:MAG: hypothetical protein H6736_21685, partial [Alphaproteobacteria bacterium]|nr:hypothetical protein [Alphaproteobacteria bacterium]